MKQSVVTIGWSDSGDSESDSSSVSTTNPDSPVCAYDQTTINGKLTVTVQKSLSGNAAQTAIITSSSNAAVVLTWDSVGGTGGTFTVPASFGLSANAASIYIGANGATNLRILWR